MSDLLGSILKNMTPPPSTANKAMIRKRQELKRRREEETKKRGKLVSEIEKQVEKFALSSDKEFQFESVEKEWRAIQHEVAETAGLISVSCMGSDNEKHVVLFKKEFCPSDEELKKRRLGDRYIEGYNSRTPDLQTAPTSTSNKHFTPNRNYQDKYKKMLDKSGGVPEEREYYGLVPVHMISEPKSIEESMSEIREKKRLKRDNDNNPQSTSSSSTQSSNSNSDSRTIKFT